MKTIMHRIWAKALTQFFFTVFAVFAGACLVATAVMVSAGFYANANLSGILQDGDYFRLFYVNWAQFGYYNRAWIPVAGVGALAPGILCFVLALRGAGRKAGRDGVTRAFPAKIPLDLSLALAIGIGVCVSLLPYWAAYHAYTTDEGVVIIALCALLLDFWLLLGWCIGLAANAKRGRWWKFTLVYMVIHGIARLCKAKLNRIPLGIYAVLTGGAALLVGAFAADSWYMGFAQTLLYLLAAAFAAFFIIGLITRFMSKHWWRHTIAHLLYRLGKKLSLFWQVGLSFLGLSFVDLLLLALAAWGYDNGISAILFLLLRGGLLALVIWITLSLRKLEKGGKLLAAGDMQTQIPTARMPVVFRAHAENLNCIRGGMQKEIEERMRSERFKTELITNVSHDIKTPLTSIVNYVDLLGKLDLDNNDAKAYIEVLNRQTSRLKKLTEDLIEASKASTGNVPVVLAQVDACAQLQQAIGEYEEKLQRAGLQIKSQIPEAPLPIQCDPALLHRVFDNLLSNIAQYAMPGTRVYIALEDRGNGAAFTFRNISREALPPAAERALLERFVRGDSARNTTGSGLGLSIAQSLLDLMGGSLSLAVDGDLFKVTVGIAVANNHLP
ncbi:MAG: HAMP domain-containing histidine kinase [Clostridiales bacterium]|nr:HAMP domain-containing histidine kinase [Clostridiales bacterium]